MSEKGAAELDGVASTVQRLAVLLSAGVPPASAVEHVATSGHLLHGAAERMRRGDPFSSVLLERLPPANTTAGTVSRTSRRTRRIATARRPGPAALWRAVAVAWSVASDAGAPLAPTLLTFSDTLRGLAAAERAAATALAAPVATARLVLVLPVVGMLFGLALGFDTIGVLVTTPAGGVLLVAGAVLLGAAAFWSRELVRRARPPSRMPGLLLDLTGIALAGGRSTEGAVLAVERAARACGLDLDDGDELAARGELLELSRSAGVPAAALLASEADAARRRARTTTERAAERLSVTLMLPLGLCVLPAFIVLGVAPMMLSLLSSTDLGV